MKNREFIDALELKKDIQKMHDYLSSMQNNLEVNSGMKILHISNKLLDAIKQDKELLRSLK